MQKLEIMERSMNGEYQCLPGTQSQDPDPVLGGIGTRWPEAL